jgi:hypothetical protein
MLAVFAEFEREILRERVKAGIAQARSKGKTLGRPASVAKEAAEVRSLYRKDKLTKSEIARNLEFGNQPHFGPSSSSDEPLSQYPEMRRLSDAVFHLSRNYLVVQESHERLTHSANRNTVENNNAEQLSRCTQIPDCCTPP